ncbi:SAC3/GANP/Nin1/mts3/eIF-3 p25 family domain containing protein [Rhypophila sp. PSN 637]
MAPTWPAQPGMAANYQAAPAFTPVQVRQNFGQPVPSHSYGTGTAYTTFHAPAAQTNMYPPAAPAQEEPPKKKIEWPDSVRSYVSRSFVDMDPSIPKADIEAKLKETITQATDKGILFSIDWSTMPLPQQMIKDERARNSTLPEALSQAHISDTSHPMTFAAAVSGSNSKKRKSSDFEPVPAMASGPAAPPPWRAGGRLEDRVTFSNDRRQEPASTKSKFQQKLEKRQKRFDGGYKSTYRSPSPPPTRGPVVGTSTELLKRYLRLTSAPNPANVRPEVVLRKTLVLLKKKWSEEENYNFICDQFKSMRQDLTVQRIRTDFTVEVYECHARIALEKGDLGEYNQCQTQLTALYKQGLKGNPTEFKAYRILYFIHTANRIALNDILATLTPAEKKDKGIKHALDVRSALALANYHRFFRLYAQTPNMGGWLMDMFVVRERLSALCYICKAYKPVVPLRFITDELFFESDADAAQFIVDYDGRDLLSEKDGDIVFASGKGYQIFLDHRAAAFSRIDIKGQI